MMARVGLVSYALDRPLTGISRYTRELARALIQLQPAVDLALLVAGSPLADEWTVRQAQLRGCRLLPGLMTLGNVAIPLAARRQGLDVVHDPTGVTPFLLGTGGARAVVTVHDVFPWSCPGTSTWLECLIYRRWLPRLLPRVNAVITGSQVSRAGILRFLKVAPEKVALVSPGIAPAFRPAGPALVEELRRQYGLPEHYILFVGSLGKRKNLAALLHAYAHVRSAGRKEPLVVAGPARTSYPSLRQALRELDLESDVILTGYVPDSDLPALYSGAELFVFPSLYEGFGLPPLEAMACGTPVVCSNAASLPEAAGDAALMVDPHDVAGLAGAMLSVLSGGDLRQDLRERGLARAARFTWERTARQTLAVYEKVLGA